MKQNTKIELLTLGIFFIILALLTLLLKFNQEIYLAISQGFFLPIFSFIFSLTLGAMLPGVIYKGGKGYSKFKWSNKFTTKTKGFAFFLIELLVAFIILIMISFAINQLLKFTLFLIPVFFFIWLNMVYVWFCRIRRYKTPWILMTLSFFISALFIYLAFLLK